MRCKYCGIEISQSEQEAAANYFTCQIESVREHLGCWAMSEYGPGEGPRVCAELQELFGPLPSLVDPPKGTWGRLDPPAEKNKSE